MSVIIIVNVIEIEPDEEVALGTTRGTLIGTVSGTESEMILTRKGTVNPRQDVMSANTRAHAMTIADQTRLGEITSHTDGGARGLSPAQVEAAAAGSTQPGKLHHGTRIERAELRLTHTDCKRKHSF